MARMPMLRESIRIRAYRSGTIRVLACSRRAVRMTELESAVEWLRDMRRVAGPHCEYATTLLDRLYDAELGDREGQEIRHVLGYQCDVSTEVGRLAAYHKAVETALERAGVLDPSEPYDVTEMLGMFLPDVDA